jgi:hypothetical protein
MLEKNEIIQSVLRNLRIEELNPMQEASLEQATGKKDVILLSPTGSGKTLAYLLPLLLTLKTDDGSVQVLILVPSRELALQIDSVFKAMGTSWKTCCCYGGHPIAEEKKSILGNHPAIIIGTPGRITDHLSKGNFNPETIHTLIIDEFDKSLEFGFHDEMAEIITQLPGLKKRMLLSATDAEEIPQFTGLNRTVKLNFLPDASEEQESRLTLMKVISPSSAEATYTYIPKDYTIPVDADYFHITTNNTIYGTELKKDLDSPVPVIADMSSDIFSRPIDVSKYICIYGGAQKNLAPAGVTFVIYTYQVKNKSRKYHSMKSINYKVKEK